MEIKISFENGGYVVRDSMGGLQGGFSDMDSAAIYANGLQAGWNAASRHVGHCHGFQVDRSAVEKQAA